MKTPQLAEAFFLFFRKFFQFAEPFRERFVHLPGHQWFHRFVQCFDFIIDIFLFKINCDQYLFLL